MIRNEESMTVVVQQNINISLKMLALKQYNKWPHWDIETRLFDNVIIALAFLVILHLIVNVSHLA